MHRVIVVGGCVTLLWMLVVLVLVMLVWQMLRRGAEDDADTDADADAAAAAAAAARQRWTAFTWWPEKSCALLLEFGRVRRLKQTGVSVSEILAIDIVRVAHIRCYKYGHCADGRPSPRHCVSAARDE